MLGLAVGRAYFSDIVVLVCLLAAVHGCKNKPRQREGATKTPVAAREAEMKSGVWSGSIWT